MGLSGKDKNTLVQQMLQDPLLAELIDGVKKGNVNPKEIHRTLAGILNEHPTIQALDSNDQRAVIGMTGGQVKRLMPKKPRTINPGERVLALKGQALLDWRAEIVKQTATPVAFLYEQARHSLELEHGHPRRRDLAWDIVNSAVTAIRYACVIAMTDYMEGGLSDSQLNRALMEAIRKPADGSWSSLLWSPDAGAEHSLLRILAARENRIRALDILNSKLAKTDLPGKDTFSKVPGLPKKVPGTLKELGDSFVSFRNELVHGVYARKRPSEEAVEKIGRLLDVLLATLEPVLTLPIVIRREDGYDLACGPAIGDIDDVQDILKEKSFPDDWKDLPIIVEGKRQLSLFPWVTIADLQVALHQIDEDADDEEEILSLSEICFFNRFESKLVHYLGFAARAQLPHTDLVESERAESAYRLFSERMEILRLKAAPAAARRQNPIQRFDELAGFHGENFVGRSDVIGSIEGFIADPPAPMGVVTAGAGMGKSAIFTHFYRQHGGKESNSGWIFHFSARADQRDNAILGLRSLIAQAEQQIQRNQDKAPKYPPLPWSYDDLCARFETVLTDFGNCMAAKNLRAVVVIDALDEQAPRPGAPPESIFKGVPEDIPENVVVLVSVRIDNEGRTVAIEPGYLGAPRGLPIPKASPLTGLTPDDVKELVKEKLAEEKPDLANVSQAVLDRVAEASQRPEDGTLDPFYLRFLADGVREGTVDLSEAGNVPAGLENFFDDLWWGLDTSHGFMLHRILGMLSEMEGFGADALFAEALKKPEEDVAKMRFGINKLLVQSGAGSGEARYGLFHDRFRWYVQSKYRERDKALQLHIPLLEACRSGLSAAGHYAVRYLTYHLAALSRHGGLRADEQISFQDELWNTIHDDEFIERKFDALREERSVVIDFSRAIEVFRPRPEDDAKTQLRKAGKLVWLTDRATQTVANVANMARSRLYDYAREGDVVRVIQLSERAGSDALQWMTLLRAAQEMRAVPLDPGPLFDAILATTSPELLWTDGLMLERLMDTADAPDDVRTWVRESVPAMGETQAVEASANEAST
ncbi:MAG: NACHT domain-containing protein [Myxococcota bacterium]|nr:NACHT domain-containing protein [Myxococcota bacterium]